MAKGVKKSYYKWYYKNLRQSLILFTQQADCIIHKIKDCPFDIDDDEFKNHERSVLKSFDIDDHMIDQIQNFVRKQSF